MVIVMACSLLMLIILKTNKNIYNEKIFFSIVLGGFFLAAVSQGDGIAGATTKGVMYHHKCKHSCWQWNRYQ